MAFYTIPIRRTFIIGIELAIDPPRPRGNFIHYDFLKQHLTCIRHKIKDVSPLRVAALTCNITLYTLPPKIASLIMSQP